MKMNNYYFVFIGVYFSVFALCTAQEGVIVSDSLGDKSYDYLETQLMNFEQDSVKFELYSKAYLRKAKKDKSYLQVIEGYYFLSIRDDIATATKYIDSAINYSKLKNIENYLSMSYLRKGNIRYEIGDYKMALDNYLNARKAAKRQGIWDIYYSTTYNIGLIKDLIGQKKEALEMYRENLSYIERNGLESVDPENYLNSVFSLADSFGENGIMDSARYYNKLGRSKSLKYQKPVYHALYTMSDGVNLFREQKELAALDSISKALPLLKKYNDSLNFALGNLYKAQILFKTNDSLTAASLLKKVDTIITNKRTILPHFTPTYELLYEFYKKRKDMPNQLVYLEKFIDYDKSLKSEYKELYPAIVKGYDTPRLLDDKEELIQTLESKNSRSSISIYILSVLLSCVGILAFYYYRKRITYVKRYTNLMKREKPAFVSNKQTQKKGLGIPETLVAQILKEIERFENNQGFLDSSLTLNKMSKMLGTNSNYLSKIINHYKDKNFSSYISELRIEHTLKELKTNPKLLNFTVKAIANEAGFGNVESFTKAFHAQTDLYPSFFIKRLKKDKKGV